MRAIAILSCALIVLLSSCKDDDPEFTSAAGDWTYTTPDGKIGVDFKLVSNGSSWEVTTQTMTVDGVTADAAIVGSEINPPSIGSIRINANDADVVYGYFILFTDLEVSSDFKEIKVPGATYTWPSDKTNKLTDLTIKRK